MSTEQPKQQTLGPFTLGSVIGSGGFGTVYRATDGEGRTVALKILAAHLDSQETLRRFEREGKIRIDHPNVVRVIDAGQDDGVSYIAFELLEGQPLNERLEHAPLPVEEVVDLAAQICAGLSAAHARGIVHRDLKPGNVFCCEDGTVKVLDFGIARPMSETAQQLTMAGSVIGTPGYLSPEQAKGESEIVPAADLWSLGVILYQALSGKNPFMRSNSVATILAVVLEEAPPLGEKGVALPRGLAELVHRCLEKDPSRRWESAEEIAMALGDLDLEASRETRLPGELEAGVPAGEQRVVALLLASEVHDVPALDAAVTEWGGELIPMLGGAIGVFGGHTYEGDENARAVSAALAARDAAGWMAVAAGRVTGAGGTVSGDAVDAVERAVEARLSGVAVDATAARGLRGQVELHEVAPGLYEVPREVSRRRTGRVSTLPADTPLLGRQRERAEMDAAIARAFDDRRAAVLWIQGPPGIGKSRLRAELEATLRSRGVATLTGRAESHRRETAFHLVANALRSAPTLEPAFLDPDVSIAQRRGALEALLIDAFGDRMSARQCLEPLARLLGVPDADEPGTTRRADPQLMADRARISLLDVLDAMVVESPLALVVDDAQWADAASLALLEELPARLADRPLLMCVVARPELAERDPAPFAALDVARIEPRGLRLDEVATLAEAIAGRPIPRPLADAVTSRTGGNPFFVEQIIRELDEQNRLDDALERLPIPLDVEGAVQSRLDHLPPTEKQLCKRAAVYSGGFTEPALSALDQPEPSPLLSALKRRGLVGARGAGASEVTGGSPLPPSVWSFRNALVADVAYRMNSDDARRELHRLAADFMTQLPGIDREELARHWEQGGEPARAASVYAEATARAARRGDSQSVLRCAERALALGGEPAFDLQLLRADALSFLGDRHAQRDAIERALALASTPAQQARALTEKAGLLAATGAHDEGRAVAEAAVGVARQVEEADVLASALARHGWLLLYAGRVSDAAEAIGEAASLPDLTPETAALVAAWRAQLFTAMGDLAKRKNAYEDASERFRAIGDLRRAASADCNLADTFNRVGAYEEAESALREAVTFCRRVGNRVVEGYALANLGYALAGQGRSEEASATYDAALAIAEQLGRPRLALAVRLYRVRSALGVDAPADVAAQAHALAQDAAELPALRASALAIASMAALAAGDADGALADAERAMALRDEIGTMEEDEAEIFLALAEALEAKGQRERAREIVALGASRLEFLAGRIADADWRARFLVEVPFNRRLIELDGR